jgi:hypothetical protein
VEFLHSEGEIPDTSVRVRALGKLATAGKSAYGFAGFVRAFGAASED